MRGRVAYRKSHIKLVMEPGLEPKQFHAFSDCTVLFPVAAAQGVFE